jgi:hypothetical protein
MKSDLDRHAVTRYAFDLLNKYAISMQVPGRRFELARCILAYAFSLLFGHGPPGDRVTATPPTGR